MIAILTIPVILSNCGSKGLIDPDNPSLQGFIPYNPQQGNPSNLNSWNLRGPGTILRDGRYQVDYGARHVIGDKLMTKLYEDANNPQTKVPFAALSNRKTKDGSLNASVGWDFKGAANIRSALNISNASTYDIKLGNTWVTELTRQDFIEATGINLVDEDTRYNLKHGRSKLILKTFYTDSLKIYFNEVKEGRAAVTLKIPMQDQSKLDGDYKITNDGGVEVSGPIMIGYVPVTKDSMGSIFSDM